MAVSPAVPAHPPFNKESSDSGCAFFPPWLQVTAELPGQDPQRPQGADRAKPLM